MSRPACAFIACDAGARCALVAAFAVSARERAELLENARSTIQNQFLFPERGRENVETSARERFAFCLTRADGARVVGRARRRGGVAVAALSGAPWFEYFDEALAACEDEGARTLRSVLGSGREGTSAGWTIVDLDETSALWEFLDRAIGSGMPEVGTTTRVGLPWTAFAGVATRTISLRAPNLKKEFNGGIKFTSVLDCGHVDGVLALFAALITERRVVLTGSRLEALSGAVHAANAALYPLSWQHIFLPVLPEGFLDYLTAPMPFLIGLHSSLVPEMKKLPCDDIFMLNLDNGEFTYFEEDFRAMPAGPLTLLRVGLLREIERTRGEDSQAVARVFRTFFSSVLGPYKQHIKGVVAHPPPRDAIIADSLWLDQDEFQQTKHAGVLAAMRGTQMYEVFVRQRLAMCAQVARKTGFVPLGEEIVDFDLEEPELTLSELMMRGQALGEQFASASSIALSEAGSVIRSTMEKAKAAYSSSTTIQNMRQAFASKRNELAASIGKLRKKSSEDLAAKWAEWTDEGTARNLGFGADTSPAKASDSVAPPPTSPRTVANDHTTPEDAPNDSPSADENIAPAVSSPACVSTTTVARALDLMSFEDTVDARPAARPTTPPHPAPDATPNFLD